VYEPYGGDRRPAAAGDWDGGWLGGAKEAGERLILRWDLICRARTITPFDPSSVPGAERIVTGAQQLRTIVSKERGEGTTVRNASEDIVK